MIDTEVIEKKLDVIAENMDYLQNVRKTSINDFTSDFEKIQATKHCIQEAIEACLDIANHIIAAEGFPRAEEYRQFFTTLAEKKVIDKSLAGRLVEMAKFRNLLVHRYGTIQSRELHKILNQNLKDITEYTKQILTYTSKHDKPTSKQRKA